MKVGESDVLVVGGGVVGTAIAYGLARAGERVALLDEGDDAFRAARGNFGLVWVQGKGAGTPPYARWTMAAAAAWPQFARDLTALTGVDLELSQIGGLHMCLTEDELGARASMLESLRRSLGGEYPFEVLDHRQLRELSPLVGPEVVGATFGTLDGHVSPLRLLRALLQGFEQLGGTLHAGGKVERIEHRDGAFHLATPRQRFVAGRVVLAAGLGNRELAPMVGLSAPVRPNRGQILVSERVQPFLRHPSLYVRQTGEGSLTLGDSKEDAGYDDGTTLEQLSRIAHRAVRCFPLLAQVNVVRTWGSLRVMSPDGLPIYQRSSTHPGAFVVTCHSGITLASLHAGALVPWLRGGEQPADIAGFTAERFHVQTH
jgi:glycine/D-amino acid oxidase-like deaminating enzyme